MELSGEMCVFRWSLSRASAQGRLCPACLIRESCKGCLYYHELHVCAHKGTGSGHTCCVKVVLSSKCMLSLTAVGFERGGFVPC